jgi:hypothetical protein
MIMNISRLIIFSWQLTDSHYLIKWFWNFCTCTDGIDEEQEGPGGLPQGDQIAQATAPWEHHPPTTFAWFCISNFFHFTYKAEKPWGNTTFCLHKCKLKSVLELLERWNEQNYIAILIWIVDESTDKM